MLPVRWEQARAASVLLPKEGLQELSRHGVHLVEVDYGCSSLMSPRSAAFNIDRFHTNPFLMLLHRPCQASLTGLLRCGSCGGPMCGKTRRKDGRIYRHYPPRLAIGPPHHQPQAMPLHHPHRHVSMAETRYRSRTFTRRGLSSPIRPPHSPTSGAGGMMPGTRPVSPALPRGSDLPGRPGRAAL